jgi:hypothetical protein
VCVIAEKYANQMHDKAVKEAAEAFNTAEDAQLKSYRVGGKYWARKRNNPTVNFPLKIANQLRVYYNEQNPHCSPDEAYTRLVGLPKYQHSLYVKYVIIPGKIKAFFGGLKSKKVKGVVPPLTSTASDKGYKQYTTVAEMREEYQRRLLANIISKPFKIPSNKEGWANLLEVNDIQTANMVTTDLEQDEHAADDGGDDAAEDLHGDCDPEGAESSSTEGGSPPEEAHMMYDLLE